MSRAGRRAVSVFLVLTLIVLAAAAGAYLLLTRPFQGFSDPVIVEFPKGTSSAAMAGELASNGIIRFRWEFLLARALRPKANLQAGEYQFTHLASVLTVYDRIARGDVFFYEVTVPEGSNIFDIAQSVNQLGFLSGKDFLLAARDPSSIRDLAPSARTLEGYLFPSTYRVTRSTTVQQLSRMMTDLFRKKWRELQQPDPGTGHVHDIVTLASLIEKETAVAEERPVVASVYDNRLRLGMALDCDPTTIYAALIDDRYRGVIHRSDLASGNEYNTYRHPGLPPGPIANPGLASIRAALAPAETNYLYFVAKPDGSGGHHFSTNITEHDRAVVEYRRSVRRAAVQQPPAHDRAR
jgi:UPF0755 protein